MRAQLIRFESLANTRPCRKLSSLQNMLRSLVVVSSAMDATRSGAQGFLPIRNATAR